MGIEYGILNLKKIVASDKIPEAFDKVEYNFEQILLHGGGPAGEKGDSGNQGFPGATLQGQKGDKGSIIYFVDVNLNDGDPIIDPIHRESDIVIDVSGDYFKVYLESGILKYRYEFSFDESTFNLFFKDLFDYNDGVTPSNRFKLFETTDVGADVISPLKKTGTVETSFYQMYLGVDRKMLYNTSLYIANLIPESVANAQDEFFAQLGLKYRGTKNSAISYNTFWIKYDENGNKFSASLINLSTLFTLQHDSSDQLLNQAILKSTTFRFIGNSVSTLTPSRYLDLIIDTTDTLSEFVILNTSNKLVIKSPSINFDYLSEAVYGIGNSDKILYINEDGDLGFKDSLSISRLEYVSALDNGNKWKVISGEIFMIPEYRQLYLKNRGMINEGTIINNGEIYIDI